MSRIVHRWTRGRVGKHRVSAEDLTMPLDPWLPRFLRCDCPWVLGLRVGDFPGNEDHELADHVIWTPARAIEQILREVW
jgi:hypothetical protein